MQITLKRLLKLMGDIKKGGGKIGLCCGAYDLLHPGHMRHLKSAKKICGAGGVLIIAVTADKHLAKSKGVGRPVIKERERAFSASQLRSVDYALVSPYETAVELIHLIRPDYFIKGRDFMDYETPYLRREKEALKETGGELRLTTDEKLSTTEIIRYIKNKLE